MKDEEREGLMCHSKFLIFNRWFWIKFIDGSMSLEKQNIRQEKDFKACF